MNDLDASIELQEVVTGFKKQGLYCLRKLTLHIKT